ncbi:hypothetical protein G8A07_12870 [Roseateles sp. DAIF2]|uniref:hypothetical protein n=1 Tax=Roseateles sp. DAIF2 TaxID=2714952 RepID=UPI0018A2DA19|nr:hypothetical protein [Roseateles sp. DAIF2]QPF73727.1 hypothetical protein G8A07_12870 [Roseateles sp. DAIF2]
MKLAPLLTFLIGSAVLTSAALAQTPAPAPTKPAANKPAATKATPATKPRAKAPGKAVPPPPPPLPEPDEAQLAATEMAHLGTYDCEFKQSISITRNTKPGYLDVSWQKSVFTMKPVLSSTGALRMEDVTGRTLMIQIGNKSMLMDTKVGQRLVDECVHPKQREAIEAARAARAAAAASGVPLEGGLGIEPRPAEGTAKP